MLVYVPHFYACALCYNDDDNLGGPVTKTVTLLFNSENMQDDKRLVRKQHLLLVRYTSHNHV